MAPVASKPNRAAGKCDVPWAERHRPRHLGEVVGNTDQVRKLAEWLRDWNDVVLKGKKKEIPAPDPNKKFFQAPPENLNARAVLISGPPGIGKTTTCSLVARCSRYKLMEFNASDARSKAVIESMSNSLAGNRTLKFGAQQGQSSLEKAVIIMDECDGMAGGDAGGMQALIKMIQNTKSPVICICNDRGAMQVKELAKHCYDLRFKRPENIAVAKRIKSIVESEGKKVELAAVESVVDACGQDIRQVINHLQFFGSLSAGGRACQKDTQVMLSPFDACSKLLSFQREPLPMERRLDMFYIDTDMVPLMIQENYLRPMEKRSAGLDEVALLERCAKASELIATADTMQGSFEVTNSAAFIGTIYPAALMCSPDEAFPRPSFPTWLTKRSQMSKSDRILQDLSSRIRGVTTCCSREVVASGYHDVLHRRLLKMLQMNQAKECAQALHKYGLTREFFSEQSPAMRDPLQAEDGYKKVEVKIKTQLLQEIQSLTAAQQLAAAKRKKAPEDKGGSKRRNTADDSLAEAEDVAMEEGDEAGAADDDNHIPGLVQKKKGAKSTNTKKSAGAKDLSKCSLSAWKQVKEKTGTGSKAVADDGEKPPLLVMRYIDGHTCSVRRKIHMRDLLGVWTNF
eukprot:TRINITY_DN66091_c0_g1_i1.p1 TRINITY_DN66091_c0_g1~~TRINITY_DN66091_c0_g1_i1.p1  ORF type:complete len:627 (-),score=177.93 TRINITY_DN66091_c0_g1_i1:153-2033(-)